MPTATPWLPGAGLIMAALAAPAGLTDLPGDPQVRGLNDARLHAGANVIAVLIELSNWYSRYAHGSGAIAPTGLVLSLVVVLILLFTGWKGWEMVVRAPGRRDGCGPALAHDPEKWTGFSDKIMRKCKDIESQIASI